jgi:hypothetical protein
MLYYVLNVSDTFYPGLHAAGQEQRGGARASLRCFSGQVTWEFLKY